MSLDLEWDETKRNANIAKHGIDFLRAVDVFAGPHIILPARFCRRAKQPPKRAGSRSA